MLYCIFTVDGDWQEYFNVDLPLEERLPQKDLFSRVVEKEIEFASEFLDGKFLHFIHTSPLARDFFLQSPFLDLWKGIMIGGGRHRRSLS